MKERILGTSLHISPNRYSLLQQLKMPFCGKKFPDACKDSASHRNWKWGKTSISHCSFFTCTMGLSSKLGDYMVLYGTENLEGGTQSSRSVYKYLVVAVHSRNQCCCSKCREGGHQGSLLSGRCSGSISKAPSSSASHPSLALCLPLSSLSHPVIFTKLLFFWSWLVFFLVKNAEYYISITNDSYVFPLNQII